MRSEYNWYGKRWWKDTLHITEEEIEDGQMERPTCCAVALAILRQIIPTLDDGDCLEPFVNSDGGMTIKMKGGSKDKYIVVPREKGAYDIIANFIEDFDDGLEVEPFDILCEVQSCEDYRTNRNNFNKQEEAK